MEDDITKEARSSTSKNNSINEGLGIKSDKRKHDCGDSRMNSECSQSSSVSTVLSLLEIGNARYKVAKPAITVKQSKLPKKKNKRRAASGRIQKREMPRRLTKRPVKRKTLKYRITKRKRSTSTIFTELSSRTISPINVACAYCGHRCCRRRYKETRRKAFKKIRDFRKARNEMKKISTQTKNLSGSECIQAGSTSLMLSTLCENTTVSQPEDPEEPPPYSHVTPEMIYESMRRLTMWKQDVATMTILEYVKRNYPVCQDIPTLCEELVMKLQVACIVGFVAQTYQQPGRWRLCCALQKRHLSSNHVTLFWTTYADTMRPVTKKATLPSSTSDKDEKQSNTKSEEGIIRHDYNTI